MIDSFPVVDKVFSLKSCNSKSEPPKQVTYMPWLKVHSSIQWAFIEYLLLLDILQVIAIWNESYFPGTEDLMENRIASNEYKICTNFDTLRGKQLPHLSHNLSLVLKVLYFSLHSLALKNMRSERA